MLEILDSDEVKLEKLELDVPLLSRFELLQEHVELFSEQQSEQVQVELSISEQDEQLQDDELNESVDDDSEESDDELESLFTERRKRENVISFLFLLPFQFNYENRKTN